MSAVARLVTLVDLDDDGADPLHMSLSARQEAVLGDGRRLLLVERGWSSWLQGTVPNGADIWTYTTVKEIEDSARVVVGPDEPVEGRSQADAQNDHWAWMVDVLRRQGANVGLPALREHGGRRRRYDAAGARGTRGRRRLAARGRRAALPSGRHPAATPGRRQAAAAGDPTDHDARDPSDRHDPAAGRPTGASAADHTG